MEIRNSFTAPEACQSFGMSMIMPKGKDLVKFRKYIGEDFISQRGFNNFCKEQEKNTKFDIVYNYSSPRGDDSLGGALTIVPKDGVNAEPLKLKCVMERFDSETDEKIMKVLDDYENFVESHSFIDGHIFREMFAAVPYWIKDIGILIKAFAKRPEDFLPSTLRKAGDIARKMDADKEYRL